MFTITQPPSSDNQALLTPHSEGHEDVNYSLAMIYIHRAKNTQTCSGSDADNDADEDYLHRCKERKAKVTAEFLNLALFSTTLNYWAFIESGRKFKFFS